MAVNRHKNPTKSDSVQQVLYERRLLMFVSAINIVGIVIWAAAVATDYWIVVFPKTITSNGDGTITHLWSHSGLWRKCEYFGIPSTADPLEGVVTDSNCEVDSDDVVFKAEATVCTIVAALMAIATGFSLYSLRYPRYTYKRVAAALHILTCCLLVAQIELVKSSGHIIRHFKSSAADSTTQQNELEESRVMYGFSYLMAWCSWMISLLAGTAFLAASKKRNLSHDCEQSLR